MTMGAVIWFCQYLLAPIVVILVSFYLGVHKERTSNKKNHDKKLFAEIEKILRDKEFMDIAVNPGYLPSSTFSKCEELRSFIINPGNQFIDKEINKTFCDFQKSFYELIELYSLSPYGGYVGDDNTFKLLADKKGEPNEKILLNEAITLGKKTEYEYRCFRALIKRKLHV